MYIFIYVNVWQQMVLAFCSSRCAASLCAKQASPTSKLSDSNDNVPITDHLWPTTKAPEYQIFRQVSGQQHHLPRWRDRRCSILTRPDGHKVPKPKFQKTSISWCPSISVNDVYCSASNSKHWVARSVDVPDILWQSGLMQFCYLMYPGKKRLQL